VLDFLLNLSLPAALSVCALPGVLLLAGALQSRFRRLRGVSGGLLVSYVTLALMLALGEWYFASVYEGLGMGARGQENWLARHWQVNSWGYRDREWQASDVAGRQTLVILGDSLGSGWGLNDPADRFGDVLARHLGGDYAVVTLARPGYGTLQELDALKRFTLTTPDVVILQYFLNDIEDDVASLGLSYTNPVQQPPPLAQESQLVSYIYWRFVFPASPASNHMFSGGFWGWMYANYDNAGIWQVHERRIAELADYVQNTLGARLIVVIFPNTADPLGSVPYVDRVAQTFQAHGVTDVLKLFDYVAAHNFADLVVAPRDHHPSVMFHHDVGDMLYDQFFRTTP
jgi:lysophospholipase L1-like esterase